MIFFSFVHIDFPPSCCFIYSFVFLLLCFFFFDMLLKMTIFQFTVIERERGEKTTLFEIDLFGTCGFIKVDDCDILV